MSPLHRLRHHLMVALINYAVCLGQGIMQTLLLKTPKATNAFSSAFSNTVLLLIPYGNIQAQNAPLSSNAQSTGQSAEPI